MTTQLNSAGFTQSLNDAIRENPVSAGLIGLGVAWMVLEGTKATTLGGKISGAARDVTEAMGTAARATGSAVGGVLSDTGNVVKSAAHHISDAISSTSEGAASLVRDTLSSDVEANPARSHEQSGQGRDWPSTGLGEIATSMQQSLRRNLDRQPILLGVIGLAIGAGIASAFASTDIEKEIMGDAGAAVKEKVQQLASDSTERVKQVVDAVKDEAKAKGLTSDVAKQAIKDVAVKVKNVASFSGSTLKDRLS